MKAFRKAIVNLFAIRGTSVKTESIPLILFKMTVYLTFESCKRTRGPNTQETTHNDQVFVLAASLGVPAATFIWNSRNGIF